MKLRKRYYDFFSHFYDYVIKLHSQDQSLWLRHYLARESGVKSTDCVLDLCTGTGSMAIVLTQYTPQGMVVGLDFSLGMLKKAKEKAKEVKRVHFVVADAGALPFKEETFNIVTCSHAMYELSGEVRLFALENISRCLRSNGRFCMMEHEEPEQLFVKFLYRLRLLSMGKEGRKIVRHELDELRRTFSDVVKEVTPTGRTKMICGGKINLGSKTE
ncbi:MAG: class I SAM-dependent methyltransferase [Thermodesulfobacteriota bacterium]|nr:class I SAM-dependent methyltransferase [Thermodesulfobacteriota bacterium]